MAREEIALPRTHKFDATNPDDLQRAIRRLEEGAANALKRAQEQKQETLQVTGVKASDYQAKFDELVLCDAPSAGMTVTLPRGTGADVGRAVVVKTIGGTNTTTVRGAADQKIDRAGSWNMTTAYQATTFLWAGAEWWRL